MTATMFGILMVMWPCVYYVATRGCRQMSVVQEALDFQRIVELYWRYEMWKNALKIIVFGRHVKFYRTYTYVRLYLCENIFLLPQ